MDAPSSSPAAPRSGGLQEIIVTLPVAAIAGLSFVVLAATAAATALILLGPQSMNETAGKMLLVLLPMLVAIGAAIGIRRTTTRQIDDLVARFLERTLRERLELACADHAESGFPFRRVELMRRARGRSYVRYRLDWATGNSPPAHVEVKMNVYNIELVAEFDLNASVLPEGLGEAGVVFVDRQRLDAVRQHPLLKHFHATLQGAVEEGYAIRIGLRPQGQQRLRMLISMRQKLADHFLASPFQKRYYAEDVSIAIGVIFNELRDSGLAAPNGNAAMSDAQTAELG